MARHASTARIAASATDRGTANESLASTRTSALSRRGHILSCCLCAARFQLGLRGVVAAFGFRRARQRGSHHIFVHPDVPELVNLQDVDGASGVKPSFLGSRHRETPGTEPRIPQVAA